MALPAYVGQVSTQDHTGANRTSLATPVFNLVAGNTVSVILRMGAPGTPITSVVDTAGNTYTQDGANSELAIWSAKNCLPHASNIVTATFGSNAYVNITAVQLSGVHVTTPLNVYTTGAIAAGVSTSVSCSPVGTNFDQMVIVASSFAAGGNPTFSPGFTVVYNGGSHSVAYGLNQTKLYDGTKTITATFPGTQAKTISVSIYNATNVGTIDQRVSQLNAEIVTAGVGSYRVSQLNAEVLSSATSPARVSQLNAEVLSSATSPVRVSQLNAEVLRPSVAPVSGETTQLWID